MEEWIVNVSYARYFAQCAPNVCTYSYIDDASALYVANTLLGLYGGLTVVLDWWCPYLVKRVHQIKVNHNKKRRIHPISTIS